MDLINMTARPLRDDEYSTLKRVPEALRRKVLSQRLRLDPKGSLPWADLETEGYSSFVGEGSHLGVSFLEHLRVCSQIEKKTALSVSAVLGWHRQGCRLYDVGEILPALHRQMFGGSSYAEWAARRLTGVEKTILRLHDAFTKAEEEAALTGLTSAIQTLSGIGLGTILTLRSRLEEEASFPEEGGLVISSHGDRALLPVPFDGMIKPLRQNGPHFTGNVIGASLRDGVLDVDPDEPQFKVFGDESGVLPYKVRALAVFWRPGSWEVHVEGVDSTNPQAVVYSLLWEGDAKLSAHLPGRFGGREIALTVAHMAIWEMVTLVLLGLHRKAITYYEPRPQRNKSRRGRGSRRSKPGAPKVCLLNTDLWAKEVRRPDPDLTPPRERVEKGESKGGTYTGPSYDVGVFKRRTWVNECNMSDDEEPIDIREGKRGQAQFLVWRKCNEGGYTVEGDGERVTVVKPA
jgi:hypothetical protein